MELKWTGLAFDPITGCPQVEHDRWKVFVKKHKGIPARFIKRPLPHLELLRKLFLGSFATSKYSFSPAMGEGQLSGDNNEGSGDSDDQNESMDLNNDNCENDAQSVSPPRSTSKGKRKSDGCSSVGKKSKTSSIDSCIELLRMSIEAGSMQMVGNKYEKA
ncbi:uncharacterized protein LOC125499575 [Beta vulgaris subsp. vulgaris]|uniref:uncharacterized protein LOC125499575 n=1 Tax=Beta vulgaris subsp. vulgaris TaxID=3555 RepID=UPI0025482F25|nr:uncharacterized protein LOC125499575 [Beta vulgaris subsp. vulgaris]